MNKTYGGGIYGVAGPNAASGPSGSGTLNYIVKWTPDGTTLGNSQLFDNGTNVGLGTAVMSHYFDVVKAQNDVTTVNITNSNAGTGAQTRFRLFNGTSSASFDHFGTGFTSSNSSFANGASITSSGVGGLSIVTSSASGDLRFYVGQGTAISARFLASNGNFGLGISPTAVLHLKAGTATASTAPLKFTSGTNLATPEAGAMEYNGTELYWTSGSSSTRMTLFSNRGGSDNLFIGKTVGNTSLSGDSNTIFGTSMGTGLTSATDNVFIGRWASSGSITSGSGNVFIGQIGANNVNGTIAIGRYTGLGNTLADASVMIGDQVNYSGLSTVPSGQVVLIGALSLVGGSFGNSGAIGYRSTVSASNQLNLGSSEGARFFTDVLIGGAENSSFAREETTTIVWRLPSMYASSATPNLGARNLAIKGSLSTGNAATGGDIEFHTTNNGASGTTLNSYVKRMTITGTNGYIIPVLPTSSAGLPTGALWNNLGIVTVA